MGQRLPMGILIAVVALCGLGLASVFLPWAVINLFGAVIPLRGHQSWTGQVSGGAFGVLAVVCAVQVIWPRLPWYVPLVLGLVVGLGVAALAIGPTLFGDGYADVSFAGGPRQAIPEAIGEGKYLAAAAGVTVALVAGWQLWRGRRHPGPEDGSNA
jgi:xanthine/uracil permease